MIPLSQYITVKRRYVRSVNLERDLDVATSLGGYTITPRVSAALGRLVASMSSPKTSRAWTVTGVFGSGKSAFAHLLGAIYSPVGSGLREQAFQILRNDSASRDSATQLQRLIPRAGYIRAVTTARREPISNTVLRALAKGSEIYWAGRRGARPKAVELVRKMHASASEGRRLGPEPIAELAAELARASQAGLVIILDELGKALEHAGRSGGAQDLFLLQQIAEATAADDAPLLVFGLLHQSFSDYGHALTAAERSEWEKIQGRFEDIVFTGAPEEVLQLLPSALDTHWPKPLREAIRRRERSWTHHLREVARLPYVSRALEPPLLASVYPLHPIAALVLPALCNKYAQNERSLFTFLASGEPHSLARFIAENEATPTRLPVIRLADVYDYFMDVTAGGSSGRPQFQRWAEVHGLIREARGRSAQELLALKTIAALNLVSSTGPLRASRDLVLAALMTDPSNAEDGAEWARVLDALVSKRLVTYRNQADEFRLWEGTDFDVETAVRSRLESERRSLAQLLSATSPLQPVVAQRHSYRTGTLRFFERAYAGTADELNRLKCSSSASDGLLVYWLGEEVPEKLPKTLADGRPVVVAAVDGVDALRGAALELAALLEVQKASPALQTDGVARREVQARLQHARHVLDDLLGCSLSPDALRAFWVGTQRGNPSSLRSTLSDLCDSVYHKAPVLWNEMINRRELTSQGARAQRELIEAILARGDQPRLGLVGEGPAYSMYASLLKHTGIHRSEKDVLGFHRPRDKAVRELWAAVEGFCLTPALDPRPVDQLYGLLEAAPFGVKRGIIPVFLAAFLVAHSDDVSVYRDGTFVPLLGPEHFEILVRNPGRFAVKFFGLSGIRHELFHDLGAMLAAPSAPMPDRTRNATLLGIVRPLVRFASSLPKTTLKTTHLSQPAQGVRDALLTASEPDKLIFESIPRACGHEPFQVGERGARPSYPKFRRTLQAALRELALYYETTLERCRDLIHSAFGIKSGVQDLRHDLRVRAHYLVGQCVEPRLRSFVLAAARSEGPDKEWLETLVMIISDRPLDTWNDADLLAFEVNVSDLARRFANLEALQKEAARAPDPTYEARRITITRPDGVEYSDLVWVDRTSADALQSQVDQLLALVEAINPEQQRRAIAVTLLERILEEPQISAAGAFVRQRKASHE